MTVDRRHFIKQASYLSGALIFTACKTVGRSAENNSSFLKVSPVDRYLPKRVSWTSLSAAEKTAFIEAVKSMNTTEIDVPAEFGEGGARKMNLWAAQAECHQWYCVHGRAAFLPWHRSYLYHFELILRKKIGDNFRLPYWDWSKDQEIPSELQEPGFVEAMGIRREFTNIAIDGEAGESETKEWWQSAVIEIGKAADYDTMGGDFESSGLIESPYHNMVHVAIGGDMGRVPLAAKDPMFWLHHCNVDRLWSLWMDEVISRGDARLLFPAVDVSSWLNESFPNHFWTAEGTLTSATVKSSLFTEPLGYNYDTMTKTWTLTDIPPDQATVEVPAVIENVATTAEGLGLAETPGSVLALTFAMAPKIFDSPQKLKSLRLKVFGLPLPRDTSMSYAVILRIAGKTYALPGISFFPGSHAGHHSSSVGLTLNKYMNIIRAALPASPSGQLILTLKDRKGKTVAVKDAVSDFRADASSYRIKLKAVFG